LEDGYSLRLSERSWTALAAALAAGRPLTLALADDMQLELEWLGLRLGDEATDRR
jgi:hypothetical protein